MFSMNKNIKHCNTHPVFGSNKRLSNKKLQHPKIPASTLYFGLQTKNFLQFLFCSIEPESSGRRGTKQKTTGMKNAAPSLSIGQLL